MYVYDRNAILTTSMKNRIYKEMLRVFTEFTTDLKIRRINPGFLFMDNEASTELITEMATM